MLTCLVSFGKLLDGQLHVVLPVIAELCYSVSAEMPLRIKAVETMQAFAMYLVSFMDHAARCVHSLCRVLQDTSTISAASVFATTTTTTTGGVGAAAVGQPGSGMPATGRSSVPAAGGVTSTGGAKQTYVNSNLNMTGGGGGQAAMSSAASAASQALDALRLAAVNALLAIARNLGIAYLKSSLQLCGLSCKLRLGRIMTLRRGTVRRCKRCSGDGLASSSTLHKAVAEAVVPLSLRELRNILQRQLTTPLVSSDSSSSSKALRLCMTFSRDETTPMKSGKNGCYVWR